MRVVQLVTDHERGGTPLRLARLARQLHARGVEVHAGCLARPGPVTHELASAGIPTFACDARDARSVFAIAHLAQHLRRIRPDLIHATLTHANVAARLVGVGLGIPVIGSTATIEVERLWHRAIERATIPFDRSHIVNSASVAAFVIRVYDVPPWRVHIVPPSIELPVHPSDRAASRAALGLGPHEFVVAWVGRFDPVKRLDVLVHVAEILRRVPVRFLLVGDGPDRPRIEQLLRQSRAACLVQLLGWRNDVGAILAASDAFLFPSRTEGMPNAVLEAMASGLPIVASDIPVLRELSAGGTRIRLVSSPRPIDYASALLALRDNPEQRTRLGTAAADWTRAHLTPETTLTRLWHVYRRAVRR